MNKDTKMKNMQNISFSHDTLCMIFWRSRSTEMNNEKAFKNNKRYIIRWLNH